MTNGELAAVLAPFLAAMRADPGDDALRLVTADCLDELGRHGWARFVRWFAGGPKLTTGLGAGDRMGKPWWYAFGCNMPFLGCSDCLRGTLPVAPVGRPSDHTLYEAKFRRGFLDELHAPAAWWAEHWQAVLALHPLRRLKLTGCDLAYFTKDGGAEYDVPKISGMFAGLVEADFDVWYWPIFVEEITKLHPGIGVSFSPPV